MLSYYLKEVLGVKSVILPAQSLETSPAMQRWIVIEENLSNKESELLERMLKAVKMEIKNFNLILAKDAAGLNIQKQDMILWFSDRAWDYQEAQVTTLCAFKHFFELEGDALKELKKSIWEKLKVFAVQ